jgi:NadR type nicotinamide-nucleotide adenylyltransferase
MKLKFAITGPESTGKSTLTEQLASYFNDVWVPEYARDFLLKREGKYNQSDLLAIAEGQVHSENQLFERANRMLFCDTEMIVMKIWSQVKFGMCDPQILQMLENQHYHHYFLCDTDIPWQDDPLREHPHMRDELFGMYVRELEFYRFPYSVISGTQPQRLQKAVEIVERFNG